MPQFTDFRKALSSSVLRSDDEALDTIKTAPYFFVRTTISALLSMTKTAKGAALEHASANASVVKPHLWEKLREPERWQIGQAYAEVKVGGNAVASGGLKKALLEVHGFDFVPESLRSNSFTEAAARVLSAHFAFNNFYNEEEPMSVLANLGTAIPMPALAKCMEATLAVWLGNAYGVSNRACPKANELLESLRKNQWEYYLGQCLPRDRTILDKISETGKPLKRWRDLVNSKIPADLSISNKDVRALVEKSGSPTTADVTIKNRLRNSEQP